MKRQHLLRPRSISDHEQMLHDDRHRLREQQYFSSTQMELYDRIPRKTIRDLAKDNTAIIRRYYGLC